MKKTNKKGFTIVELVIVIAVIAILAAVLIPTFTGVIEKANESAALENARNAYASYLVDHATDTTVYTNLIVKVGDTNAYYVVIIDGGVVASTLSKTAITTYDGYTPTALSSNNEFGGCTFTHSLAKATTNTTSGD